MAFLLDLLDGMGLLRHRSLLEELDLRAFTPFGQKAPQKDFLHERLPPVCFFGTIP